MVIPVMVATGPRSPCSDFAQSGTYHIGNRRMLNSAAGSPSRRGIPPQILPNLQQDLSCWSWCRREFLQRKDARVEWLRNPWAPVESLPDVGSVEAC